MCFYSFFILFLVTFNLHAVSFLPPQPLKEKSWETTISAQGRFKGGGSSEYSIQQIYAPSTNWMLDLQVTAQTPYLLIIPTAGIGYCYLWCTTFPVTARIRGGYQFDTDKFAPPSMGIISVLQSLGLIHRHDIGYFQSYINLALSKYFSESDLSKYIILGSKFRPNNIENLSFIIELGLAQGKYASNYLGLDLSFQYESFNKFFRSFK